jgi:putative copper resistance protein D
VTTTAAPARPRYPLFVWPGGAAVAGVLVGLALTTVAPVPGITEPGVGVVLGLPLARGTLDLAALVTVGMSMLPFLMGLRPAAGSAAILDVARRIAAVSAAVWAVAALTSLVLETADVYVGLPLTLGEIGEYVRTIGSGEALLIVAGCALLSLVIGVFAVRNGETVPAELRIAVAVFALLPLVATGHVANTTVALQGISVISMHLHVITAVVWTGGLLAVIMLMVTDRALLADVLPRYSIVATVCVFATAITGAFDGWFELYLTPGVHWYEALFTTGYGQILLLKVACVLAAALLGARTRFALLPRIRQGQRTAVATWTTVELGVMGVAFGLAVVLVRSPVVGS